MKGFYKVFSLQNNNIYKTQIQEKQYARTTTTTSAAAADE